MTEVTVPQVQSWLRDFRYKPGWEFGARPMVIPPIQGPDVMVEFACWVQDSNGPGYFDVREDMAYEIGGGGFAESKRVYFPHDRTVIQKVIRVAGTWPVAPYVRDRDSFFKWMRSDLIKMAENHEIDEWFRVDGKLVNDPHANDRR